MKRYLILVVLLTVSIIPLNFKSTVHAQDGGNALDLLILDDDAPSAEIVIMSNPDTTGVIALELRDASVTITNAEGDLIFEASSAKLSAIEFRFAPNVGEHTITMERLADVTEAYVRIQALPEMMTVATEALVTTDMLVMSTELQNNQAFEFPLDSNTSSRVIEINVPIGETQAITATFLDAPVTVQLINRGEGSVLATLAGDAIDGIRFTVAEGNYQMMMFNNDIDQPTDANVTLTSPVESDFAESVLTTQIAMANAQIEVEAPPVAETAPTTVEVVEESCTMTVNVTLGNVRSGPGTGYTVLDTVALNEVVPVGGVSSTSGWYLIQTASGATGWISYDLGTVTGSCDNLASYDTEYLTESASSVVAQQPGDTTAPPDGGRHHGH